MSTTPGTTLSPYARLPGRPAEQAPRVLRLVCFGFAGGTITALVPWLRHLPTGIEPVLAEYAGRGLRAAQTPYTTSKALLADLAPGLEALASEPFALLGYSMGGAVASHLAHRLFESLGVRPTAFVAVSARGGAQEDAVQGLADADDGALLQRTVALGGVPAAVLQVPEILQPFMSSLRADLACCRDLARAGTPPLPCPVLMLRGVHDPLLDADDEAAWVARSTKPAQCQAWRLEGGHFLHQGREQVLAGSLGDWLLRQRLPDHTPAHRADLSIAPSFAGTQS